MYLASNMSNLTTTVSCILDITGKNYGQWKSDTKLYLRSKSIVETLVAVNTKTDPEKCEAVIYMRKHLDETLKREYLDVIDPHELWTALLERYGNQKEAMLPKATDDWNNLRFQDFVTVGAYNAALMEIRGVLIYCGRKLTDKEMIEKTLSTFHVSMINVQQQYRLLNISKYNDLLQRLTMAESYNNLLMKISQSRPPGAQALPEANAINFSNSYGRGNNDNANRGRGRDRGQGRGGYRGGYGYRGGRSKRGGRGRGRGGFRNPSHSDTVANNNYQNKDKHKKSEGYCFKCGMKGHWANKCRTAEHLCKLYQESSKGKEKEVNLIEQNPNDDSTYMEATDFTDDYDVRLA